MASRNKASVDAEWARRDGNAAARASAVQQKRVWAPREGDSSDKQYAEGGRLLPDRHGCAHSPDDGAEEMDKQIEVKRNRGEGGGRRPLRREKRSCECQEGERIKPQAEQNEEMTGSAKSVMR